MTRTPRRRTISMEQASVHEPLIRINGSGWGIKMSTVLSIIAFVFVGGGAWYTVQLKQDAIAMQVGSVALTVDKKLTELSLQIERNRLERLTDIKDLQTHQNEQTATQARLEEQIRNLGSLIGDIRHSKEEGIQTYKPTTKLN